jgi:hypothetical protein
VIRVRDELKSQPSRFWSERRNAFEFKAKLPLPK